MIYNIFGGELISSNISLRPKTAFIMSKIGKPSLPKATKIRKIASEIFKSQSFETVDAASKVTGGDFLAKIWNTILSVPCGIAIVTEEMSANTITNIFYEIGLMQAAGKEILVIKTPNCSVPSDFVRTEYLTYESYDRTFEKKLKSYINHLKEQSELYQILARESGNNPIAKIDYLRRAYLLTGEIRFLDLAEEQALVVYQALLNSKVVSAEAREGTWASLGMNPIS